MGEDDIDITEGDLAPEQTPRGEHKPAYLIIYHAVQNPKNPFSSANSSLPCSVSDNRKTKLNIPRNGAEEKPSELERLEEIDCIPLAKENTIGRGEETRGVVGEKKISLSSDFVSRLHARVHMDEHSGKYFISPLARTNFTYLNGKDMTDKDAVSLIEGDKIVISPFLLEFHYGIPPEAPSKVCQISPPAQKSQERRGLPEAVAPSVRGNSAWARKR